MYIFVSFHLWSLLNYHQADISEGFITLVSLSLNLIHAMVVLFCKPSADLYVCLISPCM